MQKQKLPFYSRSRWSCFALLVTDNAEFFQHLGYSESQIREFVWDAKRLFSLGTLPLGDGGDVVAANLPDMDAASTGPGEFKLVPRPTDAYLRFEAYVTDLPATPSSLKRLLDMLIANGNYKYRASILDQMWAEQLVWPEGGTYDWVGADIDGGATPSIVPFNIFPMRAGYDATKVLLNLNTAKGIGSIKEVNFDPLNVFGMPDHFRSWDDADGKFKVDTVKTLDGGELGVPGQYCQMTSNDVFLSRATMTEQGTSASICAMFLTPNPLLCYFPKNRLSASISYGSLTLDVRSRYTHPSVMVTNEVYDYSLVIEIRNVF